MTYDGLLYSTLTKVCPGAYIGYPIGDAPPLPWFTYRPQYDDEIYADNRNYGLIPRYRVELLFKEKDQTLIDDFESALSELGTWKLYEVTMLESENCYYHDYRMTLLPNRSVSE